MSSRPVSYIVRSRFKNKTKKDLCCLAPSFPRNHSINQTLLGAARRDGSLLWTKRPESEVRAPHLRHALDHASSASGAGRAEPRPQGRGRCRSVPALCGQTGHESGPLRAAPEEVPGPGGSNLFFLVVRRQGLTVGLWEGSCWVLAQVFQACLPYGAGHRKSLAAGKWPLHACGTHGEFSLVLRSCSWLPR